MVGCLPDSRTDVAVPRQSCAWRTLYRLLALPEILHHRDDGVHALAARALWAILRCEIPLEEESQQRQEEGVNAHGKMGKIIYRDTTRYVGHFPVTR